ncbi:hypothetical protein OsI_03338 [Oryza sativa Indica Group]|uniref:Uncharacterized protein n=1 Tax=Oryza sativa subsp. indica TaxID=39946 RepID=A2WTZ1_ORYSI|nr:hypothetical protein OsI_03338 [Oryza sativa Indica Group]
MPGLPPECRWLCRCRSAYPSSCSTCSPLPLALVDVHLTPEGRGGGGINGAVSRVFAVHPGPFRCAVFPRLGCVVMEKKDLAFLLVARRSLPILQVCLTVVNYIDVVDTPRM